MLFIVICNLAGNLVGNLYILVSSYYTITLTNIGVQINSELIMMNFIKMLKYEVYDLIYECKRDFVQMQKEEHKVSLYKED